MSNPPNQSPSSPVIPQSFFGRNRTRRTSPSPPFTQNDAGMNKELENFLNANASEAYRRPWHKMERGFHLNRLRKFVDSEKARMSLNEADADLLRSKLERAYEKKLLKSKTYVIYDPETESIQEIKGLVYHRNAEGRMLCNILEKKAVTFRKKAVKVEDSAKTAEQESSPGV